MKTTFSYLPGMFENKLEVKCYFKNKIKTYYEKSTTYKCGEK